MLETDDLPSLYQFLEPGSPEAQDLDRELIWEWNQIVLQHRFQDTAAGYGGEEPYREAILQWAARRREDIAKRAYRLVPSEITAPDHCVGRNDELKCIHAAYEEGVHAVLIYGMGGIGKSTVAMQYAAQYADTYDCVITLSYHIDLMHTICDDIQLQIAQMTWSGDLYKSQRQYFKEKWSLLKKLLGKQRTLLVVDDINTQKDTELELLWGLPCDVLATSRYIHADRRVRAIQIGAFQHEEDWDVFYQTYCTETITEELKVRLNDYRLRTNGNTLLMSLAARSPELCDTMLTGLESYFLRFRALGMTDVKILRALSLMPPGGIDVLKFLQAAGVRSAHLKRLQDMSLIWMENRSDDLRCGLDPVIAESVRQVFKPTQENCASFIRGIAALYHNIYHDDYQEVLRAVPVCLAILHRWEKPQAFLAIPYDDLVTVLWIAGYYDEALKYEVHIYNTCVVYYGNTHQITGEIALRIAAVYYNSLRFDEAREWYEKGYQILKACRPHNLYHQLHLLKAAQKLSRDERHRGDFDAAFMHIREAEKALEAYKQMNPDPTQLDLVDEMTSSLYLKLEKAKVFDDAGRLQEAVAICRDAETDYQKACMLEHWNAEYYLIELRMLRAELALKIGHLEDALRWITDCMEQVKVRRNPTDKSALSCEEILADVYAAMGRDEEALLLYHKVSGALRQIYPYQKEWHQSIIKKESQMIGASGI